MSNFLQQLVNGVALGSIYALLALGYTMVYGIIGLINFAHADIYMVGAFVGFTLINRVGLGVISALILSMVFTAVLGYLVEKIAYRPLRGAPRIAVLITAIAVSMLLQNVMIAMQGPEVRAFPADLPNFKLNLGTIAINSQQLLILLITIVLMIALEFIIKKTRMGQAMRAVSADDKAAELMGINSNTVIAFTFLIGSALAGAAGVLVGIYYNSLSPLMGSAAGIKTFGAAILGGIGSIPGAMFGGLIIGLIETLVSMIGLSTWKDAVVYVVLIIILLVKPTGLFGKKQSEKV